MVSLDPPVPKIGGHTHSHRLGGVRRSWDEAHSVLVQPPTCSHPMWTTCNQLCTDDVNNCSHPNQCEQHATSCAHRWCEQHAYTQTSVNNIDTHLVKRLSQSEQLKNIKNNLPITWEDSNSQGLENLNIIVTKKFWYRMKNNRNDLQEQQIWMQVWKVRNNKEWKWLENRRGMRCWFRRGHQLRVCKKLDWFIIDQGAGGDRGLCDQGVGDQGEGDQGEGWQGQGDQGEGDLGEGGREQSDQGDGDAGQEGDQREGKGSEGRRKHDQVVSS